MIFNNTILTEGELTTKESPYDLTFEDALMHVYENECNYNELMKAVGISELRYYNDTGKELFVEEANAFEKFINAAKGFFNKIIEGIKSIFNKFMAFIRSKLSDDKKFLAKYESTLKAKTAADLKNGNEVLKIKGYPFTKLGNWTPKSVLTGGQLNASDANFSNVDTTGTAKLSRVRNDSDADNAMDVQRGNIAEGLTDDNIDKLTKAEFAKTLKENLIGTEKQEIAITPTVISDALDAIKTAKKDIAEAKSKQTYICGIIKVYQKALESLKKKVNAGDSATKSDDLKAVNHTIAKMKSASNDYTMAYGRIIEALKVRNRQSKAICVKALNAKAKEAEPTANSETAIINNLFADVII